MQVKNKRTGPLSDKNKIITAHHVSYSTFG